MNMKSSLPLSSLSAALFLGLFSFASVFAVEEVFFPLEDTYIQGGQSAKVSAEGGDKLLMVASRTQSGLDNVRKTFLLFDNSGDQSGKPKEATITLTYVGWLIANDGDPRDTVELLLYGAAGGEWSAQGFTWESAPFHDQESVSDEGTKGLELLAQVEVNTAAVSEGGVLKIRDPRLNEFLRNHPGMVTFVLTSLAGPKLPGLVFFDSDGTGRPERKPRLIFGEE